MPASPPRETLCRLIKVFEAGPIAGPTMTRRPFGGLMAGESAVFTTATFTTATAFSVRMIMDDVSLMRSQSPMHGPCQRRNLY
ncbi:hypothetical protein X770_32025 [Mesorhizobium sp. LSJC269B00]|nr:hypothetical protein X770_32025 [Mesorhizobium sp. LSJC269B00]